jgi:hypothetical protein
VDTRTEHAGRFKIPTRGFGLVAKTNSLSRGVEERRLVGVMVAFVLLAVVLVLAFAIEQLLETGETAALVLVAPPSPLGACGRQPSQPGRRRRRQRRSIPLERGLGS